MNKFLIFTSLALMTSSAIAEELVIQEIPLEAPQPTVTEIQQPAIESSGNSLDSIYTRLDAQERALSEMTGRLEQAEYKLKQMESKLDTINQDIAFRLSEIEKGQNTSSTAKNDTKTLSEKEMYDNAYNALKNTNYAEAEKQFLEFLQKFPSSQLYPNALYWLGETYYAQGHFEQALGKFSDIFTKYPQSNKAADALLKMGLCMLNLNKKSEACTAFIALPNEYPNADASLKKRANTEAEKNKCS